MQRKKQAERRKQFSKRKLKDKHNSDHDGENTPGEDNQEFSNEDEELSQDEGIDSG